MDLIAGNGNWFEAFETVTFEKEVAFAGVLKAKTIGAYEMEPPLHSSLALRSGHLRKSNLPRNPLRNFLNSYNLVRPFFRFSFFFFPLEVLQIHANRFPVKWYTRNGEGVEMVILWTQLWDSENQIYGLAPSTPWNCR